MDATIRTHNLQRQYRIGTETIHALRGPSTSLHDQQERLRYFISQRFGSSTPFQQPPQQNVRFR